MKDLAVVYATKCGHTRQYADWIREETEADIFVHTSFTPTKALEYKAIIFAGGVYNDKIMIMDWLKKNIGQINVNKFVIAAVSWYSNDSKEARDFLIEQNYPEQFKNAVPLIVLNSGIDKKKISVVDKAQLMAAQSAINKHEIRSADDINALAIIKGYSDSTSKDNLKPLMEAVKNIIVPPKKPVPKPAPAAPAPTPAPSAKTEPKPSPAPKPAPAAKPAAQEAPKPAPAAQEIPKPAAEAAPKPAAPTPPPAPKPQAGGHDVTSLEDALAALSSGNILANRPAGHAEPAAQAAPKPTPAPEQPTPDNEVKDVAKIVIKTLREKVEEEKNGRDTSYVGADDMGVPNINHIMDNITPDSEITTNELGYAFSVSDGGSSAVQSTFAHIKDPNIPPIDDVPDSVKNHPTLKVAAGISETSAQSAPTPAPAPKPAPVQAAPTPAPAPKPEPVQAAPTPAPAPKPAPVQAAPTPAPAPKPEPVQAAPTPAPAPKPAPVQAAPTPAPAPKPEPVQAAPTPAPAPKPASASRNSYMDMFSRKKPEEAKPAQTRPATNPGGDFIFDMDDINSAYAGAPAPSTVQPAAPAPNPGSIDMDFDFDLLGTGSSTANATSTRALNAVEDLAKAKAKAEAEMMKNELERAKLEAQKAAEKIDNTYDVIGNSIDQDIPESEEYSGGYSGGKDDYSDDNDNSASASDYEDYGDDVILVDNNDDYEIEDLTAEDLLAPEEPAEHKRLDFKQLQEEIEASIEQNRRNRDKDLMRNMRESERKAFEESEKEPKKGIKQPEDADIFFRRPGKDYYSSDTMPEIKFNRRKR